MKHDPGQLILPILADLIPRGDGSFVLTPHPVSADLDTWLTLRQAGRLLGTSDKAMSRQTVQSLIDDGSLVSRRPSARGTQVSLKSIREHLGKSSGPGYWDKKGAA